MSRILSALIAGLIFGVGLSLSQMINPNKVINFLDVAGNWDPSLLLVLGGAVITTTIAYRIIFKRTKPFFADSFSRPSSKTIDMKLIGGASLFGIGWGMIGFCPGPAIAGLGVWFYEPLIVIISIVCGLFIYQFIAKRTA
jgi:uncharacterized membrane protein YedE/YeeE